MKTLVLYAFPAVMVLVYAAVWFNRESTAVVNAAFPVAFGAAGALWLVFAFADPAPLARSFPVTFLIRKSDKGPLDLDFRRRSPSASLLAAESLREKPQVFVDPDERFSMMAYNEFLQAVFLDWIAMGHPTTWRTRTDRVVDGWSTGQVFTSVPDAEGYKSAVLSARDLETKLGANRFGSFHTGLGDLALPAGMQLTVEPPLRSRLDGEIRFHDSFCTLTIRTAPTWGGVGLGGYAQLLGMSTDQAQQQYSHVAFMVRMEATFQRFLFGHPQMASRRQWANEIIEGLRESFDEDLVWRHAVESRMLEEHLPVPLSGPTSGADTPAAAAASSAPSVTPQGQ